jgi:cytochrome c5
MRRPPLGRRTLTSEEATAMSLRARSHAAAKIATVAVQEPDDKVAEALSRLAARILVSRAPLYTTSADWTPRADSIEVDSWDEAS